MAKLQHFDIKFPITRVSEENTLLDLNGNVADGIRSRLMHLIFTPVGQRLRRPNFGSRLIQFIFEPNDKQTYGDVIGEIREMVRQNIQGCEISDIDVYETDNGSGLVASIKYTAVDTSGERYDDRIITRL